MPLTKQGTFTFNHSDQPNDLYNVETSAQIKSNFDSRAQELANTMNAIIDQLKAITDTDSGADNIGATAITGLTGTTVQALLEALKTQIDNVTLGQIPDNSITKQKLAFNAADQDILSSSTTNQGASLVGIEDASAHFTSTNVEGALSELFQFANDGKTNIATVVGSPATTSDTFSQLQAHIQDAKNTIATNLSSKGQTSTGTEALQALADKVSNLGTAKFAKGTFSANASTNTTINNLSFTPDYVVVKSSSVDAWNFLYLDNKGTIIPATNRFYTATSGSPVNTSRGSGVDIITNGFVHYAYATATYNFIAIKE